MLYAYCEVPLPDDQGFQYLIAHAKSFLTPRAQELIDNGHITREETNPELADIIASPPVEDSWIYCLEEFKVGLCDVDGYDEFMDASCDSASNWFSNFSELLSYCATKFGVAARDFKNQWETRIPNW